MKTTESTGLPTILSAVVGPESKSKFIELTWRTSKTKFLVRPEHITGIVDEEEKGCTIISKTYLEVCESYDEVKRLMEEAFDTPGCLSGVCCIIGIVFFLAGFVSLCAALIEFLS